MENLGARFEVFVQRSSAPHGNLDALGKFVDNKPHERIAPTIAHRHRGLEERMELGTAVMKVLAEACRLTIHKFRAYASMSSKRYYDAARQVRFFKVRDNVHPRPQGIRCLDG